MYIIEVIDGKETKYFSDVVGNELVLVDIPKPINNKAEANVILKVIEDKGYIGAVVSLGDNAMYSQNFVMNSKDS